MKSLKKVNILKTLPYIQIALGLFLLVFEIRDFIELPTTKEVDEKWGGLVDLFKYKEDTYWLMPLWGLLLISGISYWINKKLYTVLSIAFLLLWLLIYYMEIQYCVF